MTHCEATKGRSIDELELRIRRLAKRIEQKVTVSAEARLLTTVPGIGNGPFLLLGGADGISSGTAWVAGHRLKRGPA